MISQGNLFDEDIFQCTAKSGIKRSFQSSISIKRNVLNSTYCSTLIENREQNLEL